MQVIINILLSFCILLLVSTSYNIIFSLSKFFNLFHAALITIGGYFFYFFSTKLNLSILILIPLSIVATIIISILVQLYIFNRLHKKKSSNYHFLIVSIGIYTIFQNSFSLFFGDDITIINNLKITVGHEFFGAYITTIQIITIAVSLVLFIGMFLLYNYTTLGKQIRAVSENPELATVYGISQNKTILICTAISSALAAIVGILYAYDTNLTPTMGFNLLMYGIVTMIIGGVGSFRGLLFGSLLLATAQNLVAYYLDTKWMDAATYVILIAFLLWKPLGFSGKRLKKIEI